MKSSAINGKKIFCLFGLKQIEKQFRKIVSQSEGVIKRKDIEYLHRMRVASRKMLNLLITFRNCLPASKQKLWTEQVKSLARSLGKARDTDVQILFLKDFDSHLQSEQLHAGVQRFRLRLEQKRDLQQAKIIKAIDKFTRSDFLRKGSVSIRKKVKGKRLIRKYLSDIGFIDIVLSAVRRRISSVLSFNPVILDPENKKELHEFRKVNKLLRYTLETFRPVFGDRLNLFSVKLDEIHESVGLIHDCDVWVEDVQSFIEEEKQRVIAFYGSDSPFNDLLPGLEYLRKEREKLRKAEFEKFRENWIQLNRINFWGELLKTLREFRAEVVSGNLSAHASKPIL
ncbi:MAG: hypothetical protein Kow0098_09020 [Ignavibacteriaceae bacterium]